MLYVTVPKKPCWQKNNRDFDASDLNFSIKSSDYCAATVGKLSLYSTCMRSTVSFGSVNK